MGKINCDAIWKEIYLLLPKNIKKFTEIVVEEEVILTKVRKNFPNLETATLNLRELNADYNLIKENLEELIVNSKEGDFIFIKIVEGLSEDLVKQFSDIFRRLNYKKCKLLLLNEDVRRTGQNYEGYVSVKLGPNINKYFRGKQNPLLYKNFN
jgi:hypothetical protein